MKVINRKQYNYPQQKTKKWERETFQPLSDLKLRIELNDGNLIECAAFRMIMDRRVEEHACISTQVGCKFGCKFCTSGKNGFVRNLSNKEIEAEIKILCEEKVINKFDCIVFMGIGDPLDNYDEVVSCLKRLIKRKDLYSGLRRIALATVGIPALLNKLAKEKLPIDLWISLHAPDDKKRKEMMPVASSFSIFEILEVAEKYYKEIGIPVWINYMLFVGFNDSSHDALKIAKLLRGKKDIFNFIITEPNSDVDNFQKASYDDLLKFERRLRGYGVKNKIVRFMTAGKDVGAGCGEFIFIPKNKNF